jgi:hypothetical protein
VGELGRLGPTIFPILFAGVAGRFYRNLARWAVEQRGGVKLGILETISGSQSLAGTVERLLTIRSGLLISTAIFLSWAVSPIGGQSCSRLVYLGENLIQTNMTVYYSNVEYQQSLFDGASNTADYKNTQSALYSTTMLSLPQNKHAASDLWGRPKLPQISQNDTNGNSWKDADQSLLLNGQDYYTSLMGTDVMGLYTNESSTYFDFNIQASYVDLGCEVIRHNATHNETVELMGKNYRNLTSAGLSSFMASFAWRDNSTQWYVSPNAKVAHLFYASMARDPNGRQTFSMFDCVMRRVPLESEIRCGPFPSNGCAVRRQRIREARFDEPPASFVKNVPIAEGMLQIFPWSMTFAALANTVLQWPIAAGITTVSQASPVDNYVAGDDFLYATHDYRNWAQEATNMTTFSRRLTAAFNTMWQATMDPTNTTRSAVTNVPELDRTGQLPVGINATRAVATKTEEVYRADRGWCAALLLCASFLELLAVAGLVLRTIIRAPEVLGYISSLTRDNPFFPSCASGSALEGAERAQLLRDVKVHLADVTPESEAGYIAFRPVPRNDKAESEFQGATWNRSDEWRRLARNRFYA